MADSKKYDGSTWEHSLRKQTTATEAVENPLYSDGTAITNYTISGNTVQNGTPTPSNPVDVVGVGVRTENLWSGDVFKKLTFDVGYYRVGDVNSNVIYIPVIGGNTYTFSISNTVQGTSFTSVCSIDKPAVGGTYIVNGTNTFIRHGEVRTVTRTIPDGANWWAIQIRSLINLSNNIMINEGSTALPYEPYGYKIPISSGGVNLWNYTIEQGGWSAAAGTVPTPFEPGSTNYNIRCRVPYMIPIPSNTMSLTCPSSTKINFVWIDVNGVSMGGTGWQQNGSTVTAPENATTLTFILAKANDSTCSPNDFQNIMLNRGSTALPYEHYIQPTISNNYLGEVQTTRQIKKLVLTGREDWQKSSDYTYYIGLDDYLHTRANTSMSTHYIGQTNVSIGDPIAEGCCCFYYGPGANVLYLKNITPYSTLQDFKTWLVTEYAAGTPVTIWYVLATPETAAVNEPLMKIGTYADTLSNAASIPTTGGANSITVDTTVQPSEFTATWTGWHDASVKEKSENYLDENDFGLVEVAAGTYRVGTDVGVLPSGKYTFNAVKSSSAVQIYRTTKNGSTYNYEAISELPYTFTADGVSNQIFRSAGITGSSWAGLGYSDIMLSTGETAQTYEPYWQ